MRAVTHITVAVAACAFVPGVVALAHESVSAVLVVAGLAALLPDWVDALVRGGESPRTDDEAAHRGFGHSPLLAGILGAAGALVFGRVSGAVILTGIASHLALDAVALRIAPTSGVRSLTAAFELAVVWVSAVLILHNLNHYADEPVLNGPVFLLWGVAVPGIALGLAVVRLRLGTRGEGPGPDLGPGEESTGH